ncbi:MAG TPA: DUF4845 domain-containing protein [Steroidobacteraceae bacterium]|nr:DUF4845 domain-containing protein [Steroidobacteraceae bacterium]
MRHRQRGVTFIGWIILLLPTAVLIYAGIRLTPLYLEYMNIARTLDQVKNEFDGNAPTASAVRLSIEKHFDIEDVHTVSVKDIEIKPAGHNISVTANYDSWAPLFANLSIVVTFDKTVEISQ